jgi:hypothetical protein
VARWSLTVLHPALHSWRDELPATFVRFCAYVCGFGLLSITAAEIFQSTPVIEPIKPAHRSEWIAIERPLAAFALDIPEAAGVPTNYVILRHADGGGRKDILSLGEPQGDAPFLQVEIYRPGREIGSFAAAQDDLAAHAAEAGLITAPHEGDVLQSKFGALSILAFDVTAPSLRHCVGFLRDVDDAVAATPLLQLSGRFCQSAGYVERSTLACALDRLTLLAAASEPKISTLFARAELNRHFCGEHDPIIAPTPKYKLLWQALATRPEPRRIGR